MNHIPSYRHVNDDDLIATLPCLAGSERHATADLISALMEFDRRRLHLQLGFSSLFAYCTRALHLTEHEALNRIEAARAARQFPELLLKLASGELSLTAIRLLAPHLTTANFNDTVRQAKESNTEGIRLLIARLKPQPPAPSIVRKLPAARTGAEPANVLAAVQDRKPEPVTRAEPPRTAAASSLPAPSRRPVVAPLSESHYKLQVTITAAARQRLSDIQGLMRHRLPSGDPAAIVEHALEVLHAQLLKTKAAQVASPRTGRAATDAKGRYIPASIKRDVWRRDQGKCAFVSTGGSKCGSADGVEFHHVRPYAVGGEATAANIELRCRAHNGFEWAQHLDLETAVLVHSETSGH